MNKTELAILLARERVKAQAELLGGIRTHDTELAAILKGAELYDHALTESLKAVEVVKQPKPSNGNRCWYCNEQNYHPTWWGDGHPFKLCMSCGATATYSELHPAKHHALRLPYKQLAGEVSRLLGDARRAKLPPGYYQIRLAERCN